MALNESDVLKVLGTVEDPEFRRCITDLGMVRAVSVAGGDIEVGLDLIVGDHPGNAQLQRSIVESLSELAGVGNVTFDVGVMNDDQRAVVRQLLIGDPTSTAGSQPAVGHADGRAIPFSSSTNRTRSLLIASGKGGVGKSSVTTNLAIALARTGASVAIVDADVWGFSIPRMLGVDREPTIVDDMIIPPEVHGVRCISMGFFAREDQPVIWRGPMLHKALEQFLTDVFWDDPDYLLIDLPPGTGDISLSLAQFLPRAEAYVVTTPNPAAQTVAQRSAFMFGQVKIEVKGVIENMAWFTGDDGKRYELFGSGGGAELAAKLGVELIGQIPLQVEMREGSDTGHPIVAQDPQAEASLVFAQMAEWVASHAPTRRGHPELKII